MDKFEKVEIQIVIIQFFGENSKKNLSKTTLQNCKFKCILNFLYPLLG